MPPIRAALITGVMPPVSSAVEASRLMEESASMTAFTTGASGRMRARPNTPS
jgi:hypothetical protein